MITVEAVDNNTYDRFVCASFYRDQNYIVLISEELQEIGYINLDKFNSVRFEYED